MASRRVRAVAAVPESSWQFAPDHVLLQIFSLLDFPSLVRVSSTCRLWNRVSQDELLWRDLVRKDFHVPVSSTPPGNDSSWLSEYRRLFFHLPIVETEDIEAHADQVLHVSFSHDGRYFATCSKDGMVMVWEPTFPVRLRYQQDMRRYSWKYTQFSQFNEDDTLLLVSGVHSGSLATTGEIAIFSLENGFSLQCRVNNSPYDVFGAWYNANFFISGDVSVLSRGSAASYVSLVKASQEADSEYRAVMNSMVRFHNRNGSLIRNVMVVDCVDSFPEDLRKTSTDDDEESGESDVDSEAGAMSLPKKRPLRTRSIDRGNPMSHQPVRQHRPTRVGVASVLDASESCFSYSPEYHQVQAPLAEVKRARTSASRSRFHSSHWASSSYYSPTVMWRESVVDEVDDEDDTRAVDELHDLRVLDPWDKYLIFTMGSSTGVPHQVGFKRIRPFAFMHYFDAGPSLAERAARLRLREEERRMEEEMDDDEPHFFYDPPPHLSDEEIKQRFDQPDHVIDFQGHIIGLGVSPDQRYLYVNCRAWPPGAIIHNPDDVPPIAEQIDMHVIDLVSLKEVGTMFRSHKAHTAEDQCFFIFLDVSDRLVASGAEDKHGYVWDRHYGVCLAKYPHNDVVNSVAFCPADPEVLVTVSDDFHIKVWRSRRRCFELDIPTGEARKGVEFREGQ